MCSRTYLDLIANGHGEEAAFKFAVEKVDDELDRKQEEKAQSRVEQHDEDMEDAIGETGTYISSLRNDSANTSQAWSLRQHQNYATSPGSSSISLVSMNRNAEDLIDEEVDDDIEVFQPSGYELSVQMPERIDDTSSDEDGSSGSDSE